MMTRVFSGLAPALLLSACATQLTWQRRAGLDHFVGQSREVLTGSLGNPDRVWAEGGTQYAAYVARSDEFVPGTPGGHQRGTDAPNGPFLADATCITTFRLEGGRVDGWSLRGHSCFDAATPQVSQFARSYANVWTPGQTTGFVTNRRAQEDPTTGRTVAQYGVFYQE